MKDILRFIVCGSVDDGKSTLIGRLLYDAGLVYEDHLDALKTESIGRGLSSESEEKIDFSLLLDGLSDEREQGITIDLAYRFFDTEKRKFIVADAPGHEQYTRNMATGASTAELAVILVDARNGILTQTKRHTYILHMMGIKNYTLCINKMDLVDYSQDVYDQIFAEYKNFLNQLGRENVDCVPVSAFLGDNLVNKSKNMPWYKGEALLSILENIEISSKQDNSNQSFAMPVQYVIRPDQDFRGYAGQIASGSIQVGDTIKVLPSGEESEIEKILTYDTDLKSASKSTNVVLTLKDHIDITRGDVLSAKNSPLEISDHFAVHILCTHGQLLPSRTYYFKFGHKQTTGFISNIKHQIDINTLHEENVEALSMNQFGLCYINLFDKIPFNLYEDNKELGSFIIIDRMTYETVGMGMIRGALKRGKNLFSHQMTVNQAMHSELKQQKPKLIWFTGLSGAGKSTVANLVEQKLHSLGYHTYLLDGDNIRFGLNKDLGFKEGDRAENVRRIGEVGKLMLDAGLIVFVSCISPFQSDRDGARKSLKEGDFIEVFVDASLDVCEKRDPKGLYKKARNGEIKNLTGLGSPYEKPLAPEIYLDSNKFSAEELAEQVLQYLLSNAKI